MKIVCWAAPFCHYLVGFFLLRVGCVFTPGTVFSVGHLFCFGPVFPSASLAVVQLVSSVCVSVSVSEMKMDGGKTFLL